MMFDIGQHIEKLNNNFINKFHHVVDTADVPEHWQDYCTRSTPQRLSGVRNELRRIGTYFPQTAQGLGFVTTDVFLARNSSHGLCRFFIRQLRGKQYLAYSRQPKLHANSMHNDVWNLMNDRAPEALVWVYNNIMDGLTDIYDFTGFKSSLALVDMNSETDLWGEMPWYKDFFNRTDTSKVVEVLSSGGGAYLMLDLSKSMKTTFEPQGLLMDTQNQTLIPEAVDFFPYLDEWTAIGLAETDLN